MIMSSKNTNQFALVPDQVTFDPYLDARDTNTYSALRSYRNEETKEPVYPSMATIAKRLGCDQDTIARSIKRLVERGHLTYEKGRRGRSNRYQFKDDYTLEDSRTCAGTIGACKRVDSLTDAEKLPAPARPQPELSNHNQKPGRSFRLFYDNDPCSVKTDGTIWIITTNGWMLWSGHYVEAFRFGSSTGEDALREAKKRFCMGYGSNVGKSDTLSSLPTSEEDFDSSSSDNPALSQSND